MDFRIDKDKKTLYRPTTIENDLMFQIKAFYGFIIVAYIALGVLVIVG